jgi:RES domain-containing protein
MTWNAVMATLVAVLSAQLVAFQITYKTMSWGGELQIVGILCPSTVGAVERCVLILSDSSLTHGAVRHKSTATSCS